MDKFIPCSNCVDGYIYYRATKDGSSEYVKRCQCLTNYIENKNLELRLKGSGLALSIVGYDIKTYIGKKSIKELEKVEKFIKEFKEKFYCKHLYIFGPNGTQKTTIAQYIGRELIRQGLSIKYALMNEIIKTLSKEGFEKEVQQEIKDYYKVDCLIIDEAFDKEKILWYKSNYQMNFLDSLLRKRIDQYNKSIIFVSNKFVESINDNFNTSIYDLIKRNTEQTILEFYDHYSLKNDFDPKDLWK